MCEAGARLVRRSISSSSTGHPSLRRPHHQVRPLHVAVSRDGARSRSESRTGGRSLRGGIRRPSRSPPRRGRRSLCRAAPGVRVVPACAAPRPVCPFGSSSCFASPCPRLVSTHTCRWSSCTDSILTSWWSSRSRRLSRVSRSCRLPLPELLGRSPLEDPQRLQRAPGNEARSKSSCLGTPLDLWVAWTGRSR